MARDNSLGESVYYQPQEYAGFVRRIVVIAVDSLVILFWIAGCLAAIELGPFAYERWIAWLGVLTVWLYLTVIKSSRLRTVGYRVTGLKIVNVKGERPSVFRMTFRMLLWTFWPLSFVVDLLWLAVEDGRVLRDCYAGTYVVRNGAEPAGRAQMHLAFVLGMGATHFYPKVTLPVPPLDSGVSQTSTTV